MTTSALKAIDKYGGVDNYVLSLGMNYYYYHDDL